MLSQLWKISVVSDTKSFSVSQAWKVSGLANLVLLRRQQQRQQHRQGRQPQPAPPGRWTIWFDFSPRGTLLNWSTGCHTKASRTLHSQLAECGKKSPAGPQFISSANFAERNHALDSKMNDWKKDWNCWPTPTGPGVNSSKQGQYRLHPFTLLLIILDST